MVSVPPAGAVTVTVKLAVAPLARLAMAGQVTIPALAVPLPVALMKVTWPGSVSAATTLFAVEGPELVRAIV